jgi:hypothetical protein
MIIWLKSQAALEPASPARGPFAFVKGKLLTVKTQLNTFEPA